MPSSQVWTDARALALHRRFMKQFFPREVKVKQRENELEVAREDMEDSGMDVNCVIC